MEEKIDILLATYNGEQYIYNQILSLQQQTHTNWHLYIRDDGSSDKTLDIIAELMLLDSRITLVADDKGGLGSALNFKELFYYSTAEYVICCDQDDIWFEKKLELLLKRAQQNFVCDQPCVVYCDGYGYDTAQGTITINSIASVYTKNLAGFLFFNGGRQGCSTLMNRCLVKIFQNYHGDYMYMHDSVISLIAYVYGQVFFLPEKLMLYRQHETNVTGNMPRNLVEKLKLNLFTCSIGVLDDRIFKERKAFFIENQNLLSKEQRYLFTEYLRFPMLGKFQRLRLVIKNGFRLDNSLLKLCIKILLRP